MPLFLFLVLLEFFPFTFLFGDFIEQPHGILLFTNKFYKTFSCIKFCGLPLTTGFPFVIPIPFKGVKEDTPTSFRVGSGLPALGVTGLLEIGL